MTEDQRDKLFTDDDTLKVAPVVVVGICNQEAPAKGRLPRPSRLSCRRPSALEPRLSFLFSVYRPPFPGLSFRPGSRHANLGSRYTRWRPAVRLLASHVAAQLFRFDLDCPSSRSPSSVPVSSLPNLLSHAALFSMSLFAPAIFVLLLSSLFPLRRLMATLLAGFQRKEFLIGAHCVKG